ncbi:MAG TPA: TonB-dependent receptor, partial [Chitinophagaceae bacterium]
YQQVMGGSYGLFRTNTAYLSGSNNASLMVDYGHQTADGYRQHSRSLKDFITLSGDFYINENSTVSVFAGYSSTYDQLSGETDSLGLFQSPKVPDPDYVANNANVKMESTRFGLNHDYKFTEHFSNATSAFGGSAIIDQPFAAGVTKTNKMKFGARTVFTATPEIGNVPLTVLFGAEFLKNFNYGENYSLTRDTLRGINSALETQALQYNLLTQVDAKLTATTILTIGASENFMEYNVKDMLRFSREYTNSGYYLRFSPVLTPRIGINQLLGKNIAVYGNISKGYSPPATNQFIIPQLNSVNTGLKPESALSYEVGAKGNLLQERLNFELALFAMTVEDKLVPQSFQANGSSPAYTITTNAGRVQHNGLETSLSYAFQPHQSFITMIRPFVSYTYSDFTYRDYKSDNNNNSKTVDYSGKKESGVAPNLFNAGFDAEALTGFYLNATVNYVDKMPLFPDDSHYAPCYSLLNAKLGFKKVMHTHYGIDMYVGSDNITNTTYPSMVFVNLVPRFPGQALEPFLPGEKRNWYGGISFRYIF